MRKPENFWVLLFFAAALCAALFSEAFLRQAAVARINPAAVNMDEVISDLPGELQQKIRDRILLSELRNALARAETDSEKIHAMLALAAFEKDPAAQDALYRRILAAFPDAPESYPAYVHYLFEADSPFGESAVSRFHRYQENLPAMERYYAWDTAYDKLRSIRKNPNPSEITDFLAPLTAIRSAPFLEYSFLYRDLGHFAGLAGRKKTAEEAFRLAEKCGYRRSIAEYRIQIEEDGRYRNELSSRKAGTAVPVK